MIAGDRSDTLRRYCLCGGAMHVRGKPLSAVAKLVMAFDQFHDGPGHGPATRQQAANARRREEAAIRKVECDGG